MHNNGLLIFFLYIPVLASSSYTYSVTAHTDIFRDKLAAPCKEEETVKKTFDPAALRQQIYSH